MKAIQAIVLLPILVALPVLAVAMLMRGTRLR